MRAGIFTAEGTEGTEFGFGRRKQQKDLGSWWFS